MGHMDLPVELRELEQMYGVPKTYTTRNLIIETITKTVRNVDSRALSVPFVKYCTNGVVRVAAYPMADVVSGYGTEPKPLQALLDVLCGSDCPLVAKWREAMAQSFADANADEVDEVMG